MTSPVVVTAVFRPLTDAKASLVDALERTIPGVHAEEGCLLYAIHDASDGTITMLEKWASADDLRAHSTSAATTALAEAVEPYLAEPTVVTTMTPIATGTPAQGAL